MKILLTYLKPYKWHIALALLLAGINQTFSMFDPMIFEKFPFPSIVLASTNDEKVSLERAMCFAEAWGSEFVNVGDLGHMGSLARLGAWPVGEKILTNFLLRI